MSPPAKRGASGSTIGGAASRASVFRAVAKTSAPAAGASSTATGSADRYVQRAFRPGRALSSNARPGRSERRSATSIGTTSSSSGIRSATTPGALAIRSVVTSGS